MPRPRFSEILVSRRHELGLSVSQASRVLKLREDVLIAFGHKANYRALIATLLMKQKVVVCVRTDPTGHYDGKTDQILIPLLFPRAAGFVFQTTGQRDFFPSFVRKNSTIILNPVNPDMLVLLALYLVLY